MCDRLVHDAVRIQGGGLCPHNSSAVRMFGFSEGEMIERGELSVKRRLKKERVTLFKWMTSFTIGKKKSHEKIYPFT